MGKLAITVHADVYQMTDKITDICIFGDNNVLTRHVIVIDAGKFGYTVLDTSGGEFTRFDGYWSALGFAVAKVLNGDEIA
jgi:hypothetical protein